jgi:hypothetical protein
LLIEAKRLPECWYALVISSSVPLLRVIISHAHLDYMLKKRSVKNICVTISHVVGGQYAGLGRFAKSADAHTPLCRWPPARCQTNFLTAAEQPSPRVLQGEIAIKLIAACVTDMGISAALKLK